MLVFIFLPNIPLSEDFRVYKPAQQSCRIPISEDYVSFSLSPLSSYVAPCKFLLWYNVCFADRALYITITLVLYIIPDNVLLSLLFVQ